MLNKEKEHSRKKVTLFVSYARSNKELANSFLEKLQDILAPSKKHEYSFWIDKGLIVGEGWDQQIREAIDSCDLGLLLISPAFLASKFISENVLPIFVSGKKASIPVMLRPVDFALHDLQGLEKQQIFLLDYIDFKEPRAYADCKGQRRDTFVFELFEAIEDKLTCTSSD